MSVVQTAHQKTHGRTSPTGPTHPFPLAVERPGRTEGTHKLNTHGCYDAEFALSLSSFVTPPIGASDGESCQPSSSFGFFPRTTHLTRPRRPGHEAAGHIGF